MLPYLSSSYSSGQDTLGLQPDPVLVQELLVVARMALQNGEGFGRLLGALAGEQAHQVRRRGPVNWCRSLLAGEAHPHFHRRPTRSCSDQFWTSYVKSFSR